MYKGLFTIPFGQLFSFSTVTFYSYSTPFHHLFPSSVISSHIVHIPCSGLSFFSILFLLLFSMFVFVSVWCRYVWRLRALVVRRLSKSTELIWFDLIWFDTRVHSAKKQHCHLEWIHQFFLQRVVDRWNSLSQLAINSSSNNSFKNGQNSSPRDGLLHGQVWPHGLI